jgi:transcriptional regulator with XRE-family HTH domain
MSQNSGVRTLDLKDYELARVLYAMGYSYAQVATRLGISRPYASRIINRKTLH